MSGEQSGTKPEAPQTPWVEDQEPTAEEVAKNFDSVQKRLSSACAGRPREMNHDVTLVAVSKFKSPSCVQHAYAAGHRVFGENYVKELAMKAKALPTDIQWHFIGHLQSNKCNEVVKIPNVVVVQTVDSAKLADCLDAAVAKHRPSGSVMGVFLQVNTSGEESKSGVDPEGVVALATHIASKPRLCLGGLMTIGMPDFTSKPENFTTLIDCRAAVAKALSVDPQSLHLSMGMSGDFEAAVLMSSTTVRVGSSLFGPRPKK